jgi:hypothetical protein
MIVPHLMSILLLKPQRGCSLYVCHSTVHSLPVTIPKYAAVTIRNGRRRTYDKFLYAAFLKLFREA